ncbi:hypothetical protein HUJ04_004405 [Dendroctonus ponderosae]|nr:hypothetical protein HUJ04_004405 [Dendroctonus ponderosae]
MADEGTTFTRSIHFCFAPKAKLFTFLGIFPAYNFQKLKLIDSKVSQLKVYLLCGMFTLSIFIVLATRAILPHRLLANEWCEIIIGILSCIIIVSSIINSWTRRNSYHQIITGIGAMEKLNTCPSITKKEKRIRRHCSCILIALNALNLQYAILFTYWLFCSFPWPLRLVLEQKVVYVFYITIICYLTIALLTCCREKYKEVNAVMRKMKQSQVYEESAVLKQIRRTKDQFRKLSEIVKQLNSLLSPVFLFMPTTCSLSLLELGFFLKHVWPQNSDMVAFPITKLLVGITFFSECFGAMTSSGSQLLHLSRFFTFLGILPPYSASTRKVLTTQYHLVKVATLIAVYTALNFISLVFRQMYHQRPIVYNIVECLTNVSLWLLVVATIGYSYSRTNLFQELYDELRVISVKLRENKSGAEIGNRKLLHCYIKVMVLLVITWISYYAPPGFNTDVQYLFISLMYIQQEIVFYFYCISTCFVLETLQSTCKTLYQDLNRKIWKIRSSRIFDDTELLKEIKTCADIFMRLSRVVQILSKLFAPIFSFLPMVCSSWIVHFSLYMKHWGHTYFTSLGDKIGAFIFISILLAATSTIMIRCDQIVTESKKIMTTCYDLQDCLSIYSKPYAELQEFTKKIPSIKVEFTASGLFRVDRSIIFSVMGSVATYFIVVEQFLDKNGK